MAALHQQVRRTIRREALLPPGTRVLVGLSGGADSVALLHLLLELAEHGGFSVVAAAHFNHQLRATADRDERFCCELAQSLGVAFHAGRDDVAGLARREGRSVEDAARRARYEFLEQTASRLLADRVAVAHTCDDQAETVLLKLVRGAGLTGLGGIAPRRGRVIRPLLDVGKRDLVTYLRGRGLVWVEDETNADLTNPRNRIRHRVLPELEDAYPGAGRTIARAAAVARSDAEALDGEAAALYACAVQATPAGLEIDVPRLTVAPEAIIRRVLLTAMRAVCGSHEIGLDHIRAAEDVLGRSRGRTDVPGARLELRRKKLVLSEQRPGRSDTLTK
jgi:tRNA(Ile)-lysidine synthase